MSLFRTERRTVVRSVSYPYSQHTVVRSQLNPLFMIAICVCAIVLALVLVLWPKSTPSVSTDEPAAAPVAAEPPPPTPIDFSSLDAEVPALIAQYSGYDIGVSVVDVKTGQQKTYGLTVPFVAASTGKLLTAITFLHHVESGRFSLTQPVGASSAQAALEALIVESDNTAWDSLNNKIMNHAMLAEYAAEIGITNYNPDTNTTNPENVAKVLSNLYDKKLLNEANTALLLGYMSRAKEVEYVSNKIPAGVAFYHKAGYLRDRVHDATIIDNGERPYSLVIFTKSKTGGYDSVQGQKIFESITESTFKTFSVGDQLAQ